MDATLGDLLDALADMGFKRETKSEAFQSVQSEMIDVENCSSLTGYTPGYIRQLVFKRAIPFYKGKNRRPVKFKRTEIVSWMTERKFTPLDEQADNYLHNKSIPLHKI